MEDDDHEEREELTKKHGLLQKSGLGVRHRHH